MADLTCDCGGFCDLCLESLLMDDQADDISGDDADAVLALEALLREELPGTFAARLSMAKRHGWQPCEESMGRVLLWHPSTPYGIEITWGGNVERI